MQDCEIAAGIAAGDAGALAAAYDRYAPPLHAFCCTLLADPADAAAAVQDTFVIAAARLADASDQDDLRPWLYAVARNECHRILRARPGATHPGPMTGNPGFGAGLERAGLHEVVGSAVAALPPRDREVVELSLRQGFTDDELALVLGLSGGQAKALAARVCGRFERSLGALLVARSGRPYCARLDELLEAWDGQQAAPTGDRLERHIRHCRECSGCRDRELEQALLLGLLPVTAIARDLRERVLGLVASGRPDAVAYRDRVLQRTEPPSPSGFPVPVDPPEPERSLRRPALAVAAVVVLAVLGAVALEVSQHHGHRPQPAAAALGGQILQSRPRTALQGTARPTRASSSRAGYTPGPAAASGTPAISVSVSPTVTAPVPSATTRAGRSSPPSSPPSTPPTTSPPPPAGTVSVSPASVTLGASPSGGAPSGSFTLTASGGSVSYTVTVPAQYAGTLAVSSASGSLTAGASVTISVSWQSSAALQTALSVGPGGQAVSVSYQPLPAAQGAARRQ